MRATEGGLVGLCVRKQKTIQGERSATADSEERLLSISTSAIFLSSSPSPASNANPYLCCNSVQKLAGFATAAFLGNYAHINPPRSTMQLTPFLFDTETLNRLSVQTSLDTASTVDATDIGA
jgi:hypothetical protein